MIECEVGSLNALNNIGNRWRLHPGAWYRNMEVYLRRFKEFLEVALFSFTKMRGNVAHKDLKRLHLVFSVLALTLFMDVAAASTNNGPNSIKGRSFLHSVDEFSNHEVIQPKIYHGIHKIALNNTLNSESRLHESHITLSYYYNGERVIADLHLNEHLIPERHFVRYQDPQRAGEHIVQNFTKIDVDLCHYQGILRGKPNSRVAVSTCNGGVNGMVRDDDHTYFIHSDEEGRIHDDHFLFRHADLVANATCGYNSESNHIHETNETPKEWDSVQNRIDGSEFNRILRYKRSSTDNIIRGPFNANKHSSFVELVIVVDNKVYKFLGESMKKVHKHCKDLANIVNALYEPLNIFIALVGVVVWNESNEIEFSEDGDKTLQNFLYYRRTKLATNHPNDNAQLLTKEPFNGGVVGKALKGPICTYEFSGGVAMEHSQIVAVVAATMAHEMGHNFGMEHDTPECRCPEVKCIMSASSTSVVPHSWSDCSIDQLNVAFSRGMNYCLRNKPTKLFDSPQCGNGFVEPGEQCDCGLPQYCKNTCCDPYTCMLRSNASCATGECCDFNKCLPKPAGTNCRQAENECDLPEFCTGASEYCPSNVFKRDTESCDNGNAYCYQGNCRSRNNQCRILWGPSGQSSEHCYWKNLNGTRHGNCGFDRINTKYEQCKRDDILCGMLHCKHLNERLEFGMESVAVLSHSFLNHQGSIIPCRTAIVDLGLETTDPGLTPSGAKCGDDKMCVDRKCRSIESLRLSGIGKECPNNCNGHGQCNSKGNCHCDEDFAPPFCEKPGSGGSIDSGPAKDLSGQHIFTTLLFIVFLGIVPLMVIMLFAIRYRDQLCVKRKLFGNIMKSTTKGPAPRPPPSSPNGGLPKSTPSSTDDMNSALLKSPSDSDASTMNNGMFGKFKGFTLKPLSDSAAPTPVAGKNVAYVQPVSKTATTVTENEGVPARAAPPVPKHATLGYDTPKPNGLFENAKKASTLGRFNDGTAPALPPPNPGSHPRPIISNPVLEASTCREIGAPGKPGEITPARPAPTAPQQWTAVAPAPPVPLHTDPKLNARTKDQGTIKRIASFLKKEDKYPPKVKPVIDKEKLKNIEISAPIPQVDTSNSDSEQQDETKNLVKRAQSMRSPTKKQPAVQTFGSMRNPTGVSRPKSVIGSARPKSPPPRPPGPGGAIRKTPSTTSSGYQLPLAGIADHTYDDCEAVELPLSDIKESPSPSNSDNIYSVIDEAPATSPVTQDNMGLLGEIVNEIEKRNVDSIYSASTMKSSSSTDNVKPISPYEDVPELDVLPEPEYIKSNSSTASGGYIRPPAVNAPIARVAPTRSDSSVANAFSSFKPKTENATSTTHAGRGGKSTTPPVSTKPSTVAARAKSFNKSPSRLTKATTSSQPTGSEMNTTGEAVAKKPLPSGAAKPKPLTKPSVTTAGTKPTINRKISANKKPVGSSNVSSTTTTTTKPVLNGSVRPLGKTSTVASLQQKFENSAKGKPPITG